MGEKYFKIWVVCGRMSAAIVESFREWKTEILREKYYRVCMAGGRMRGAMVEWYWEGKI